MWLFGVRVRLPAFVRGFSVLLRPAELIWAFVVFRIALWPVHYPVLVHAVSTQTSIQYFSCLFLSPCACLLCTATCDARGCVYANCSFCMWPHCLDALLQPGRAATQCRASLQLRSSVTVANSMCIATPCSVFRPCTHTHTFEETTTQMAAVCTRVCLPLTMAWCNFYFTFQN